MRRLITIISIIALIACTVLYTFCFDGISRPERIPSRPGNLAVPGIEAAHVEEAEDTADQEDLVRKAIEETFHGEFTMEMTSGTQIGEKAFYTVLCTDGTGKYFLINAEVNADGLADITKLQEIESHAASEIMAFDITRDVDEYDMADILLHPELVEQYKLKHKYLDDMVHFPVEGAKIVQEIGYSRIWQVMEVRTAAKNGGEEVQLYKNIPHMLFEDFRDAEDVDGYYIANFLK